MRKNIITIYTDGAARRNPGPAGWGAIIISNGKIYKLGGGFSHATNNQMELTAPIEALNFLSRQGLAEDLELNIFSDSKYVILGITEWIFRWQKNGWRNAAKKPVLNKELWIELFSLASSFKIKWSYVEGHAGNKWNERADEIATGFADGLEVQLKREK